MEVIDFKKSKMGLGELRDSIDNLLDSTDEKLTLEECIGVIELVKARWIIRGDDEYNQEV